MKPIWFRRLSRVRRITASRHQQSLIFGHTRPYHGSSSIYRTKQTIYLFIPCYHYIPLHTLAFQLCTTLYLTQIYIYPFIVPSARYILFCNLSGMNVRMDYVGIRLRPLEDQRCIFSNTTNAKLQNDRVCQYLSSKTLCRHDGGVFLLPIILPFRVLFGLFPLSVLYH